jgi:nicotinamide mononucleotide transporter
MDEFAHLFIKGMQNTTWYEYVGVFAGIASVWFSRKEHILVYPIGLINTIIFIYISYKYHLLGEASVNFYYTIMSMYGWLLWTRKDAIKHETILHITYSNKKEWIQQIAFFSTVFILYFTALSIAKNYFFEGVIPAADAFATATAFTGMWLMAKKKVESWYWWIATNIASIPLYFVKTLVFTSVQYVVLLIMAIAGLIAWKNKVKKKNYFESTAQNCTR